MRAVSELPREFAVTPRRRGAIAFAVGCGVLAPAIYIATDLLASFSIATIAFVGLTALAAFLFVPAFLAQQPTPGMGLAERAGQYAHQGWLAVFACVLLRRLRPRS